MLIHSYWLLLLPIAAASGWFAASGKHFFFSKKEKKKHLLPKDYLLGLNFLLNEEPDKALDVFIRMLEVDSETVETHLALGNLFRRRGEVDRATRIHQNLIARPNLKPEYRAQALLALAQDYLSAGVLDRAERLFLELLDMGKHVDMSLQKLVDIYQQEKEWEKAINIAMRQVNTMRVPIAHFYCELAQNCINNEDTERAIKHLKRALATDKECVRASLLMAGLEIKDKRLKHAMRLLKRIREQNADYFSEAIAPLAEVYQEMGKEKEMIPYFRNVLKEFPRMPIVLILSEQIRRWKGDKMAANFVTEYVRHHPSIGGLHRLVELHLPLADSKAKKDLLVLHNLTEKLLKEHALYQCQQCGFEVNTLHWQCPSCKQWSTIQPTYTLSLED